MSVEISWADDTSVDDHYCVIFFPIRFYFIMKTFIIFNICIGAKICLNMFKFNYWQIILLQFLFYSVKYSLHFYWVSGQSNYIEALSSKYSCVFSSNAITCTSHQRPWSLILAFKSIFRVQIRDVVPVIIYALSNQSEHAIYHEYSLCETNDDQYPIEWWFDNS